MDQQFRDFVRKLDLHRNAVGLDSACLTRYETPPTLFNAARIISLMQARHSASSSSVLIGVPGWQVTSARAYARVMDLRNSGKRARVYRISAS